ELREHPAIRQLIVEDNRVPLVLRLTRPAKSRPERIICSQPKERSPGFAKDLETEIAHDHNMVGADLAIGIRRRHAATVAWSVKANEGRRDLLPVAGFRLNNRIGFQAKVGIARDDVLVFVLTQL